jgi:hypothetical protein
MHNFIFSYLSGSAQESDCSMDNVSFPHDQYHAKEGGGGTSTTWRCLKAKAKKQDLTTNGTTRNLLRASAFKSENPFFMIMMQPAYICGKGNMVSLQLKFSRVLAMQLLLTLIFID